MSDIRAITVEARDRAGKGAARATRRAGLVPGVIYGDKKPATLVALDPRVILAEQRKKGFHTRLFDITVNGGGTERALVRDVQFHVVTDVPLHIDFQRVTADTLIHAAVPVHFKNEAASPGIKRGGVLNVVRHDVELVGKATDMPDELVIDMTGVEIGASIHISSIKMPEGVRPAITDRDFTVATLVAPTVAPAGLAEEGAEG